MSKSIAILTSSRADFGIYLPLLNLLKKDASFDLKLIVFGTHLSKLHGHTVDEIMAEGFNADYKLFAEITNNRAEDIANNYAEYTQLFSTFWASHTFDLVLALGDRFEMAAAVLAGVPYNVKFGHLHAGETTLGAIDNIYRHCITLASSICFTSTQMYSERVHQLVEATVPVVNVGALSLDGLENLQLPSKEDLAKHFNLDFSKPLIMVVFHPETVEPSKNEIYINEVLKAVELMPEFAFAINMPNADTGADIIRKAILDFKAKHSENKSISIIEHFGKRNYFACLKHANLLIGNSSSGIIEAASFNKYVLNMGNRQKGRAKSENTKDCAIDCNEIIIATKTLFKLETYQGQNIYQRPGSTAELILSAIKSFE